MGLLYGLFDLENIFSGSPWTLLFYTKAGALLYNAGTTRLLQQPGLHFSKGKKDPSQQPLLPKHAYNIQLRVPLTSL